MVVSGSTGVLRHLQKETLLWVAMISRLLKMIGLFCKRDP